MCIPAFSRTIRPLAALLALVFVSTFTRGAEVNLLAFGDWGQTNSPAQRATAQQMAAYATRSGVRFDAALTLGDNFYSKMPGGVSDPRWQVEFEQMYDAKALPMPFYAALGNHDYEQDKAETQLAYAKAHPDGRWKLPANRYRIDFPAKKPLVSVLVLDSNFKQLGAAKWQEQLAWMARELADRKGAAWMVVTAHHPLFTAGQHGDTRELLADWGPLFKQHKLDFFLCGHDHDLQHLEMDGWSTSFVLAGGGGATIRPMKRDDRGPFSRSLNGFFHLRVNEASATGKFIDAGGNLVHEFARAHAGKVQVVQTTGRDKPGTPKKAAKKTTQKDAKKKAED